MPAIIPHAATERNGQEHPCKGLSIPNPCSGEAYRVGLAQPDEPRNCTQAILAVLALPQMLLNPNVERSHAEVKVLFEAFGRDMFEVRHKGKNRDRNASSDGAYEHHCVASIPLDYTGNTRGRTYLVGMGGSDISKKVSAGERYELVHSGQCSLTPLPLLPNTVPQPQNASKRGTPRVRDQPDF